MKTIGLAARGNVSSGLDATLRALGHALGASFEERRFEAADLSVDAWVVLGATRDTVAQVARAHRPCYVVIDHAETLATAPTTTLTMASEAGLDEALRGRIITADDVSEAKALPDWLSGVTVLASKPGGVVWAAKQFGNQTHQYVGFMPPELTEGETIFSHFSRQRLLRLLPLLLFVRSIAEGEGWTAPPLQAAFMFDDPNLHWPSYGFISYHEVVRRATAGSFHVSFATIPLDSWFVHRGTARLFAERGDRISLLCHGNDHLRNELGRAVSAEAMGKLLRQAAGRLDRMETRTGLRVSRVMAPPHGACRELALAELERAGFEAICISRGSLAHHNPGAKWTQTIGLRPCDVINGVAVIPRFGLSTSCRNDILIAALLRQPIVPIAHHRDVAAGYGLLEEVASLVNSLGRVQWHCLEAISRSLYSSKQVGGALWIRMWSRRVVVPIPSGASCLRVQPAPGADDAEQPRLWRNLSGSRSWNSLSPGEAVEVGAGARIEILSPNSLPERRHTESARPQGVKRIARRALTEARDRALPPIHRVARLVQPAPPVSRLLE